MTDLTLENLTEMVRTGTAARCHATLQPAGGEGTKVFPPTYAGGVYATEHRRLPGHDQPVPCVLLDSVQSQANRMEEALQQAIDTGRLKAAGVGVPVIEVDFTDYFPGEGKPDKLKLLEPVGRVSSLQAPHRIADAILRDSLVADNGKPFRAKDEKKESEYGQRLRRVTPHNATALLELCPTALVFGMWDSTGPKGGLGAKFERAMVSEVVGLNAVYGVKTSSRLDPLAIQLKAGPIYKRRDESTSDWTLDASKAVQEKSKPVMLGKDGKPSEANHGNVTPSVSLRDRQTGEYLGGGVTISAAQQTVVLSLPVLRRLRFPVGGVVKPEVDMAAQTALAALGLCAAVLAAESGLGLRSRCLLWPTAPLHWEFLGRPGEARGGIALDGDGAIRLLKAAVDAARKVGLLWREPPLILKPSEDLVELVAASQRLAQKQGADKSEGGES